MDDVKCVEELAFVFVNTLDLNVEQHFVGDIEWQIFFYETSFIMFFDFD